MESNKGDLDDKGQDTESESITPEQSEKQKGHGRLGADAYTGIGIKPEKLTLKELTRQRREMFLEWLEQHLSNSISTRNVRLAVFIRQTGNIIGLKPVCREGRSVPTCMI